MSGQKKPAPAFQLGEQDYRRGHRTNPFAMGRQKRQWQAGYDFAYANNKAGADGGER